ncbi:PilZ domain-containing protein [Yoonia sp.]|uniref:PilZ domain-containing protein n=1 Tax=Yoonia sp. TaxID=2212373 RepID=UPI0019DF3763|nr:PilZ domain-containing protein [Yoonia sp.]MBE0414509.1 PilZ domain-containing protein [Yoonia sp.]
MQYRPHRYNTHYPVTFETPSGPQRGTVIDVNTAGARVEGLKNLSRGDKVRLSVLSLRINAVVRWVANGRVGVIFSPRISSHQVDILRYRRDGRPTVGNRTVGFQFREMH